MEEMQISKHARKRIAERVKIPKRAIGAHVAKSIQKGKTIADFQGNVKNYIRDRYHIAGNVDLVILYQDFLYIWAKNCLVTVLVLPDWVKDEIANTNSASVRATS